MTGKAKRRPKVALLIESSRSYGRGLLRGVALFARTRCNWSLLHQEMTIDASLPDWLANTAIDGVIARADKKNFGALRRLGVPVVDVRCHERFEGVPQVETDDRAVADLAFKHLWDRGFRRFAFCGFQFAHYSVTRLSHFRNLVQNAGCSLSIYETPSQRDMPLTSIEGSGVVDSRPMSAWLSQLQPPTGLFVCNDIRGQQVLNACRSLEIAVPDDIGVIGVDDDDAICPLSDPPLSSVRPDAEQVGFRAAEILHEMLQGRIHSDSIEYIAPWGVVQRLSTQVEAVDDRELARACQFIREHACEGIQVSDVLRAVSISRRQLERRFREILNRSLHDEISGAQVARVQQLLCETKLTLEQIAPLAGYSHKERLSVVFKRATGQTPGEYRRSHAT